MKRVIAVYKEYLSRPEHEIRVGVKLYDGKTAVEITERLPMGEGDVHYCLVTFDDGSEIRICRPDFVLLNRRIE